MTIQTKEEAITQARKMYIMGFQVMQMTRDQQLRQCSCCILACNKFAAYAAEEFLEMKEQAFEGVTPNTYPLLIMATFRHAVQLAEIVNPVRCEDCK